MSKDVMITLLQHGATGNEILMILDSFDSDDSGAVAVGSHTEMDADQF
jgi:hypothetical protein